MKKKVSLSAVAVRQSLEQVEGACENSLTLLENTYPNIMTVTLKTSLLAQQHHIKTLKQVVKEWLESQKIKPTV